MRNTITRNAFIADLRQHIAAHCTIVSETFSALTDDALGWQPQKNSKMEWSILHCLAHLNLTHDYYMAKIETILADVSQQHNGMVDGYRASFWGGIYMHFALNPRYTFPSPEPVTPVAQPTRQELALYLARQDQLLQLFARVATIDLIRTPIPIEKFVRFNLGDCLKILVYHDELHIGQAQRVYEQLPATN